MLIWTHLEQPAPDERAAGSSALIDVALVESCLDYASAIPRLGQQLASISFSSGPHWKWSKPPLRGSGGCLCRGSVERRGMQQSFKRRASTVTLKFC